jgi:PncC family amidohydrolase
MDKLLTQLKTLGLTVTTIESFTGGLLSDAFVSQPGASEVFRQGLVLYQAKTKAAWLGMSESTLEKMNLVSKALIEALLSRGVALGFGQLIIATTGNAGPTVQGHSKIGQAWIGITDGQDSLIESFQFEGNRQAIRQAGVKASLNLLQSFLSTYYQRERQ